jgi:hypothetical protein
MFTLTTTVPAGAGWSFFATSYCSGLHLHVSTFICHGELFVTLIASKSSIMLVTVSILLSFPNHICCTLTIIKVRDGLHPCKVGFTLLHRLRVCSVVELDGMEWDGFIPGRRSRVRLRDRMEWPRSPKENIRYRCGTHPSGQIGRTRWN